MTLVLAEFSAPWSRSVRVAPTTSHPTAMAASTAVRHQHRLRTERCRHRTPGAVPFEAAAHLVSRGITVDDDTVRTAMRIAFEEFKIVLEPSGAIALAAALRHGAEFGRPTRSVRLDRRFVPRFLLREALEIVPAGSDGSHSAPATLCSAPLVHQAFLRLVDQENVTWLSNFSLSRPAIGHSQYDGVRAGCCVAANPVATLGDSPQSRDGSAVREAHRARWACPPGVNGATGR